MSESDKSGESSSTNVASSSEVGVSVVLDEAGQCVASGDYRQAEYLFDRIDLADSKQVYERAERLRAATSVSREGFALIILVGVGLLVLGLVLFI